MINYFTIKEFLSMDECNKILNFSLKNLDLKPGKVMNNMINEKYRKSSISFANYDTIFPFLKIRLVEKISEKIKLKGYDINFDNAPFQFTEYKVGEYYNWHTDSSADGEYAKRYCSVVIQLNNDYTGGDLQMKIDEKEDNITFENGIGNLFVFLSEINHRVTPVDSGIRYSLVSWFSLKPINNYKKTLI
jgi:PKHD-type hydroxylase